MKRAYDPKRAWLIAIAYFAACVAIATLSGVLPGVLAAPLATPEQLASPWWLAHTGACLAVIIVAYGVIWPIGTFTDGRTLHPLLAPAYGFAWGLCQGLWFLTIYTLIGKTGLATIWVAALSYLAIGGYNALYHSQFWDIHVSPPHNYTEWNVKKVLLCHTPNLLVSLSYLAIHGNAAIFALLQGLALALSATFMRFPAPWDDYAAEAGRERRLAEKPVS